MLYAYDEDKPWTSVGHRILATLWRVLQLRLILIVIFSSLFTKSGKFCQVSNAILNWPSCKRLYALHSDRFSHSCGDGTKPDKLFQNLQWIVTTTRVKVVL